MTRMVEEQRGLIGTYKALGYGKGTIALKYVSYALAASLCRRYYRLYHRIKAVPLYHI